MKKIIKSILGLVILTSLTFSCKNNLSLQQFIIDQQEKQDVLSFDLSSSLLAATEGLQSETDIKTLKSLKKINILAYQIKDSTNVRYNTEIKQIKAIFNQDKYTELIRYGKGSQAAKVYLLGEADKIDELVVFANDNKLGWLLVRILGEDMKPEKIIQLIQKIDFDKNDFELSKFKGIFK